MLLSPRMIDSSSLPQREASRRAQALILATPTFRADLSLDVGRRSLTFQGSITSPDPALVSFLEDAHGSLLGDRWCGVTVDFRRLQVLTPSGLEAFHRWTRAVQLLPEGERYQIRFLITPHRGWQRTSLLVLQGGAPDVVEILE
jgi:hypothetical protein